MKFLFIYLLFPLFLMADIHWQASTLSSPFALSIDLDKDTIDFNQTIELKIKWQTPSDYKIDIEKILKQLGWSANSLNPSFAVINHQQNSQELILQLKPLQTGKLLFSLLTLLFQNESEEPIKVETPVWTIQVNPLASLTMDQLQSAPLMELTPEFPLMLSLLNREQLIDNPERQLQEQKKMAQALQTHTFPWILFFSLLGLGGIIGFIYLTRQEWVKPQNKPKEELTINQQISLRLKSLQKQVNQPQVSAAAFYHQLTQFTSYLLSIKSGNPTSHYTTKEWETALPMQININHEEFLKFLQQADQVKFAHVEPSLEEKKQALKYVEQLTKQLNFF